MVAEELYILKHKDLDVAMVKISTFLEELNIFWKYICRKNFQSDVVLMVPDS